MSKNQSRVKDEKLILRNTAWRRLAIMQASLSPLVCVMIPCYNEEENIPLLYDRIVKAAPTIPDQRYCLQFIDNASTDATVSQIKALIERDPAVQLIVNMRDFGAMRSGHAWFSAGARQCHHQHGGLVGRLSEVPLIYDHLLK